VHGTDTIAMAWILFEKGRQLLGGKNLVGSKNMERGCGQGYEWFAQKPSDAVDSSQWRKM